MEQAKRGRRRHGAEFKQQVLAQCEQAGASVARVALSHGINANLVHKWRRLARGHDRGAKDLEQTFVPITLATSPTVTASTIRVEVCRGAATVHIEWPTSAAAACAAWLRAWLA